MHDNERKAFNDISKRISRLEMDIEIIKRTIGINTEETQKRREELEKLPMQELRKIGDVLGVKDTKKSELIDEIIESKT